MYSQATSTPPSPRHINLHEISAFDYLQLQQESVSDGLPPPASDDGESTPDPLPEHDPPSESTMLVNSTSVGSMSPGDIQRVLSNTAGKKPAPPRTKWAANVHISYTVSSSTTTTTSLSHIDRGSNGGVAGTDVRLIHKTSRTVDIQNIDNH
jgi:hypothetical protein